MADYPYFPLYVEDFLVGTAAMPPAAVGIYIKCLAFQWSHGDLPDDPLAIARLAGALPAEVDGCWEAVRRKFATSGPGKLQNARLESERAKVIAMTERRSEAGHAGAQARWSKRNANAMANAFPEQCGGNGKTMARASDSDSSSLSDSLSQKGKPQESKTEFPMRLPELSDFPEPVRDEECRKAWHQWLIYKATKIRKPYKTERGHRAELTSAAKSGRDAFLGAIALSMDREWRGVRLDLYLNGEGSELPSRGVRKAVPV